MVSYSAAQGGYLLLGPAYSSVGRSYRLLAPENYYNALVPMKNPKENSQRN